MELPAANYDFAYLGSERDVISEQFMPEGANLFLANLILSTIVDGYDGTKRFSQIEYKLSRVVGMLRLSQSLQVPIGWEERYKDLRAYEVFIGYLVLDALVGNTDRHHENWGVVARGQNPPALIINLSPTFDHASSLGRSETTAKRHLRLTTRDERATVEAYASKARSAFFGTGNLDRALTQRELLTELAATYPESTRLWAERAASISLDFFTSLFSQISSEWISEDATEFALRMLRCNQRMIQEVVGV